MAAILYNTYWLRYIYIVEKIVRRGIVATIEVQIKDRENESFHCKYDSETVLQYFFHLLGFCTHGLEFPITSK